MNQKKPIGIASMAIIVPVLLGLIIGNISKPDSTMMITGEPEAEAGIPAYIDTPENGTEANLLSSSTPADSNLTESQAPVSSDPCVGQQWGLSQIQAPEVWPVTTGSPEILVAVLDTGIDRKHPDLAGKVAAENNFTDNPTPSDVNGHGTHIAGIIAANTGIGTVGIVPEVKLMNAKVASDNGRCETSALAEGIIWAVDNGADILNISIQISDSSPELQHAVDYAWERGVVIIAAAGNSASNLPTYPAGYGNCIAVAAVKQDNALVSLSNRGDWVDVAAPGFDIYSTLPDSSYGYKTGTSFAAAYVTGIAALLLDVITDTNGDGKLNDEVREAIEAGCQDIGIDGVGNGLINAVESMAAYTK
ncbi:S8 family serine peptidase [Chloroflexota bacterium]